VFITRVSYAIKEKKIADYVVLSDDKIW